MRQIDRQLDVPAIWKLQISQSDTQTTGIAAAALDHVARSNREPAGKTIC